MQETPVPQYGKKFQSYGPSLLMTRIVNQAERKWLRMMKVSCRNKGDRESVINVALLEYHLTIALQGQVRFFFIAIIILKSH